MAQHIHDQHDNHPYTNSTTTSTSVSPLLPSQRQPLLLQTSDRNDHDLNDFHLVSPIIMSRSPSIISALSGGTAATFPPNPANVRPLAAYVAPFGAAQVVSTHEDGPNKEDVSFSPSALALVNAFLDQLLFSILSTAKSTTLGALRPAVIDILKNKLARDAIAAANEELADLLAGGDEDEDEKEANADGQTWDVELVWRRTRLRVMVYMRLGEMEDDDEERHVKEQELYAEGDRGRFSSTAGLVSWSAAIFLTSVLEHVAEQTLQAAGSAAYTRVQKEDQKPGHPLIVEDQDAERIALSPSLGRLWRSWRRTIRANIRPTTPTPRDEIAVVSPAKSVSTFRDSFGTAPESAHGDEKETIPRTREDDIDYPEHIIASNIRLPLGDPIRDVDEIEIPGLARDPSEDGSQGCATPIAPRPDRRRSFSHYQTRQAELFALSGSMLDPVHDHQDKPQLRRRRSNSVPTPYRNVHEVLASDDSEASTGSEAVEADRSTLLQSQPTVMETQASDVEGKAGVAETPADAIESKSLAADVQTEAAGSRSTVVETEEPYPETTAQPAEKSALPTTHPAEKSALTTALPVDTATLPAESSKPEEFVDTIQGTANDPPPENKDFNFDIDEIDKRKSLIDIKTLLAAVNGGEAAFIAKKQHQDRPRSAGSDQSFSLGNKENGNAIPPQPFAERQHMTNDDELAQIGVATTSDRAVAPERSPSAAGKKSPSPTPMAINDISRASSVTRSKYSPALPSDDAPATQEAPARDRPIEPNEQTLAALRESVHRASSPQTAQQAKTIHAGEVQTVQARKSIVPVSAFNKTHEQTLDMRDISTSDTLTSANIRGPEDFDHYGGGDKQAPETTTADIPKDKPTTSLDPQALALAQLTGEVPPVIQSEKANGTADRAELSDIEKRRNRYSVSRPPTRNSSVLRRSGMMAREARVVTESTRDFADFIRSTRPDKEPQIQPLSSASVASLRNSMNYSMPRTQSMTSDRTRSLTRSDIAAGHAPPVPNLPATRQDRPKSGAPSRSTMDSDQFNALRSNPVTKADVMPASNRMSVATTNRMSVAAPSKRMSTALTNGSSNASNVAHPAYSGQPQSFGTITTEDPQRKRYRNKDPYALDLDDDDDEEEDISALPRGQRGGETLAEFLRSQETKEGDNKPIASAASLAQAKELMERAKARGSRSNSIYQPDKVDEVTALPPAPEVRPTNSKAAERLGLNNKSDTQGLADFLRDTGPTTSAPAPSIGKAQKVTKEPEPKKEKKGFFSFFRRGSSKPSKT